MKKRILIVDDNELNRELLKAILSAEYEIELVENGAEAIEIVENRIDDFDLMLLDIVMPKVDGFGVLEKMNAMGWIKKLPVVLISVEYSQAHIDKAFDLGVFDFISRPFSASVVKRRVGNAILLASTEDDYGLQFMTIDSED